MKTITMLELRTDSEKVVKQLRQGESLTLTYRGHPLARLTPIADNSEISADDPLYRLHEHADDRLKPLSNDDIDGLVYER
jgi:prevent-host-death family protein